MIQTHSIRHGEAQLFARSDVLTGKSALHHPYLVLQQARVGDGPEDFVTHITQVRDIVDLIALPDDTVVIWQWEGKQRSDFFTFTIAEFRAFRSTMGQGAPVAPEPASDLFHGRPF